MIVNGGCWPGMNDDDDSAGQKQLRLRSKNVGLVADSFSAADFTVIVDDIYIGSRFYHLLEDIKNPSLYFVLLTPDLDQLKKRNEMRPDKNVFHQSEALYETTLDDTPRQGLWLDTSTQSVAESLACILNQYEREALLDRKSLM